MFESPYPDVTKRKDDKTCHCTQVSRDVTLWKACRFGCCELLICWKCALPWAESGPVACPHKKNENGTLRRYKYPDMDEKIHVPVKRSKNMRKRNQPPGSRLR